MDVGLDPELTKWSVRSGPAIVLTGKGYKERHWLVVPPSTTSIIPTSILPPLLLYYADVRPHHPRNSRRVRSRPRCRPGSGPDREPYQRREGHYSLHVQRGRLPCKFLLARCCMCTDDVFSTLVTRKAGNTLRPTSFIVVPTRTIRTRTGSKIFTGLTSSTRSAVWLVASFAAITSTLINALPSVGVSFVTTRARRRPTPPWN